MNRIFPGDSPFRKHLLVLTLLSLQTGGQAPSAFIEKPSQLQISGVGVGSGLGVTEGVGVGNGVGVAVGVGVGVGTGLGSVKFSYIKSVTLSSGIHPNQGNKISLS